MRTYQIILEDRPFKGNAIEIINFLKSKNFFRDTIPTVEEFIKDTTQTVWRLFGKSIVISPGLSLEDKAESLIDQLIKLRMIIEK